MHPETLPIRHLTLPNGYLYNLHKLGIYTLRDLLFYFPRDHVRYYRKKISQTAVDETVTIVGKIKQHRIFTARNGKLTIQSWTIVNRAGTHTITCTHFHHSVSYQSDQWRAEQSDFYRIGKIVMLSGKVKADNYTGGKAIEAAEIKVIDRADVATKVPQIVIQPVYRLSQGISKDLIQDSLRTALQSVTINDPLPRVLRKRYDLMELEKAIAQIHFPKTLKTLEAARRRLVFDEFFYLQLGLLQRRQALRQTRRDAFTTQGPLLDEFYRVLPFALTPAQQRVIQEILADLSQSAPMNRLVQGDVGSGKTVVAIAAILSAIQSGYQAALMAPTEVLAEQHYRKVAEWFQQLNLPVALLTGSMPTAQRREIYQKLRSGQLPLVIGTHALIQKAVTFHRLGLVAIDEQHRFGVEQRTKLQQKGDHPHTLSLTATPIPRTLALTLHGDLDLSQIDERPPGRQPILTKVLPERKREKAYEAIRRNLVLGHQAYIILPLVEKSEKLELKAAIVEFERLQETTFPEFRLGLLHGKMSSAEKEAAIAQFRTGETQILVSTTVIEVGVDVPNAAIIIIEHAERFGLAQLHQLRGRVGRGQHQSYCFLIDTYDAYETRERLEVLEQSQDGFFIADMDLKLRGPGETLGTAQAGLPKFALADLQEDAKVLIQAREVAQKVIGKADRLRCWTAIAAEVERRHNLQKIAS